MRIPEYIILTPIAPLKLYSLDRFLKNVMFFKPKPQEMVFCAEPGAVSEVSKWKAKLKKQGIKLMILVLEPEIVKKFPRHNMEKLTYSREHLRHYFVDSPYKWALWLDSDILPQKDAPSVLMKIANSQKVLAVSSEHLARCTEGLIGAGAGCLLVHKEICRFAKFQVAQFFWKGEKVVSLYDDVLFFWMLNRASALIEKRIGWSGRIRGRFVSIRHIPKQGSDKFLKKDTKKSQQKNI